ncbi:MAG: glycosyltransferase family 2 protein, partial [Magnetococcus sp. DMHC-8]
MIDPHMVVVIPCHDEPDLLVTLASLWACRPPACPVEVMVVVNGSAEDGAAVQSRNRLTWEAARAWRADHREADRVLHLLYEPALPPRQAGVGTARKLGMDWALTRFAGARRDTGVIVCLDADCVVAANYLEVLAHHFASHPHTPGCSIYFEHPWTGLPDRQRLAIIQYELFLRYYLHGLRWSGFPHAFHTIGSSMAVRAAPYRRQGGMNRRKAGEDFYFLQKIIPLGGFSDVCSTTVFPSARSSHRVPFGTGRAMADG